MSRVREVLSNTCKGSMRKADMANHPEMIVVGAGVMGCGTAYWLSKAGYKVLVLEQEAIACGASGVAAAMLEAVGHGAHLAVNDPLTAFARAGFELHQELQPVLLEESGVDIGYRENPVIHETVVKPPGLSSPCTMKGGEGLLTTFGVGFPPHI
jgi:hypothetical protein